MAESANLLPRSPLDQRRSGRDVSDGIPRLTPAARADARAPHVVIIVENMTVPPDRRVWQQAKALRDEGWRVTVITPKVGSHRTARETIDGINIRRHSLPMEARALWAYAAEYATALTLEAVNLIQLGLDDIDVVQICNPPDFLFAPALMAKKWGKAKIVFDHHDLTPELLADKFDGPIARRFLLPFARWAQQQTFKAADHVISTNNAFRTIAIAEGGKTETSTSVVYSAPDSARISIVPPNPALKNGADKLVLWVGVMGSQDGLDLLVDAVDALKAMPGGDTFHLMIVGDGPYKAQMQRLVTEKSLDHLVTFAGFLTGPALAEAFCTADIGVGSDPKTPFNDRLAMNKVMEYMAYGLPFAMFDLGESRKIAGDAALYAANNDPKALAAALSNLLTSPSTGNVKGARGRERLSADFSWEQQRREYLSVFRRLIKDA